MIHINRYRLTQAKLPQQLADFCGETVHIAIHDNNSIVYINKIDSKHSLQLVSRIGRSVPLHCTAIGKVIMADLPKQQVAEYLGSEPYTQRIWSCYKAANERIP